MSKLKSISDIKVGSIYKYNYPSSNTCTTGSCAFEIFKVEATNAFTARLKSRCCNKDYTIEYHDRRSLSIINDNYTLVTSVITLPESSSKH